MVEIGNRPIIWHIMKIYSAHGINDFVICCGYRGYVVKEFFSNYYLHMCDVTFDMSRDGAMQVHQSMAEPWRVTLVDTGQDTMTGGRLRRISSFLNAETFCLTYGDGLSDIDLSKLVAFHRSHGRKATVTAIPAPGRFGVLQIGHNGSVTSMAEKAEEGRINGGFFVLEPSVLDYIAGDQSIWEREPMERLASEGELISFPHEGFWHPMDTLRDKRLLEELWSTGRAPWKVW
jgi:glucose-1-phosphate cytidylyltransferase